MNLNKLGEFQMSPERFFQVFTKFIQKFGEKPSKFYNNSNKPNFYSWFCDIYKKTESFLT